MGISISEFDALTPQEAALELEEASRRRKSDSENFDLLLRLLDGHLATIEMLLNNAHFKRALKVSDFKMIEDERNAPLPAHVLAIDAKLRAEAQERIRRKRGSNWQASL